MQLSKFTAKYYY